MALSECIHIARRFSRSVRIDSDLGAPQALEGFVCPQSSADVLLTMARHVSETGQGAFTWTGPYGSGKSSLVVALSALLNGNPTLQNQAQKVFGEELTTTMAQALPHGEKGWRIIPVVGRRDDPVSVIGEALQKTNLVQRRPRGGWSEEKVIRTVTEAADADVESYGGVILFIDEMGKFLEAAVQQNVDIYVFQQLAEAAARSNGRFLIVGILHQAFQEYAHRLSHEIRDEWAKIQGRFVDLPVNVADDEQVDLISRAIECDDQPEESGALAQTVAVLARRDRPADVEWFARTLQRCWPLHPVVACLLGPMSRSRFGQNQRSIFGFLNSMEPHGFQDFLRSAEEEELYGPDRLWDYLRTNLEPSILASPDAHRWALAAEALDRCEAVGGDALHLSLLKMIAVIDLFKNRSGLVASFELLQVCLRGISERALEKALRELEGWSFTIFRKYLDAHAIFAGSDFDIDQAVRTALDDVDEIDFATLSELAGLQPILAKRHYHDTGALRWFEVSLVPVSDLAKMVARSKPDEGTVGKFVLAIPTEGESDDYAAELCSQAAHHSGEWDVVVGLSKRSWTMVSLARELIALESVRNDRPELAGDAVARREVAARLAALQGQIESELYKAFDSALWFRKQHQPSTFRHAELNALASELADVRFNKCPKLHNELLNREKPSGSAIAAQNILLRCMVLNEGQPRLGIEGFPAHGGLFASVLEATGLYGQAEDEWRFRPPQEDDPCRLSPMWEAAVELVRTNVERIVAVSELYDLWRRPPFGVKDGLMPVLVVAFILSQRNNVGLYRESIFRARFDDIDVEYLAKDPSIIQLRWMKLSDLARRLLSEMAEIVRMLDNANGLVHLEPIDVARGLVAIYEDLPRWTKRTMRLSANAVRIRELFKRANDPNQFLFDDIPAGLDSDSVPANDEDVQLIVDGVREGLKELLQAYPSMLRRLQELMFTELEVPNDSPQSLAELRVRADNVRQISGDFHLEAFVSRLSSFDGTVSAFEGIASLAASKPPQNWVDPDFDRAAVDIAEMAQKFLRAETYTRVKGRPTNRQAMAVVVGLDGRPTPLLEEFDIADSDRATVNDLIERVAEALNQAGTSRRSIILAALAELSASYMKSGSESKGNGNERAVS